MINRRLAQSAFWLSGEVMRIKTPQQTYRIVSFDPFVTEPVGRSWQNCRASMWLLRRSMRLDWEHWDHWALVHDRCSPLPCIICGGCVCADTEDDDELSPAQ